MTIGETAAEYRARPAWCASDMILGAQTCMAQMWAHSDVNPDKLPAKQARELDDGTAIHLAIQDPAEFERQTVIIDAADYRTKAAQEYRDGARFNGLVPLLVHQVDQIMTMRRAVLASPAGEWVENAKCEQTFVWEWHIAGPWPESEAMPCKARVDLLTMAGGPYEETEYDHGDEIVTKYARGPLLDIKSAKSASPDAFQRAIIQYGHHIRAAWYEDGWLTCAGERRRYGYLVVQKEPPYLVSLFWPSARALEWGRREYRRVLAEIRECQESGIWCGYEWGREMDLPSFAEYRLAEAFAEEDAP